MSCLAMGSQWASIKTLLVSQRRDAGLQIKSVYIYLLASVTRGASCLVTSCQKRSYILSTFRQQILHLIVKDTFLALKTLPCSKKILKNKNSRYCLFCLHTPLPGTEQGVSLVECYYYFWGLIK